MADDKENNPEEHHVEIFRTTHWNDFTAGVYMPAFEMSAGVEREETIKECINTGKCTLRTHEMPTFYVIDDTLTFFHPRIKDPLLFVYSKEPHITEVMSLISKNIHYFLVNDISLDYSSELDKKKPLMDRCIEHSSALPGFEKVRKPINQAKRFADFLSAICKDTPIDSQFKIASSLEKKYAAFYSRTDKGKVFMDKASKTLDTEFIKAYLSLRTLKQ